MFFYNVTCNVSPEIAEAWIKWMKEEHLPAVMRTGLFDSHTFCRLLTEAPDNEGINYTIQYKLASENLYRLYNDQFAPALRKQTMEKWGEQVLAFRSTMVEV